MVPNPCCCMTLQSGVTIMAIIDIILNTLNILSVALAIAAFITLKSDNDIVINGITVTDSELNVGIGVLIVLLIIGILSLTLSIRLYYGAKKRDMRNCKIWLIVTAITLLISVVLNIINATAGEINSLNIVSNIISILYRLYMMWVVFAFLQELKSQTNMMGFQARLEDGIGYSMQSYPQTQPGGGIVYSVPTSYPQQQQQQYVNTFGAPQQAQPNSNSIYNPNNQYNNSDFL